MSDLPDDVKVQILQAQPGDIVVFSYPGHVTFEQALRIKEQAERILPADVTVAVMDSGGHVDAVVRPS